MADGMAGKKIGNYQIEKEIGRGGMGVVYRAVEPALGRTVALKVLPANLAANEAFIQRFNREARAVAQLNHPNVVTIFTIGEDDGQKFLAMEFVHGRDLSEVIREHGSMDVRRSLEIVRQCADALSAAHTRGIIHRDIKPHNIMLGDDDRPKVMDFGIAKLSEEMTSALTRTGDILGTPAYMSPEQCRGKQLDGRSDLYSLGVVFYQMLSGHLPFSGDTPVTVIQKILFEDAPSILDFNPDIPPAVVHMIERCMSKEPEDRYTTGKELARDIDRFLAGDHSIPLSPPSNATQAPTRIGPSKLVREVRAEMPTAKHKAQAFKGRSTDTTIPQSPAAMTSVPKAAASSLAKGLLVGGVVAVVIIGGAIFGVKSFVGDKRAKKSVIAETSEIQPVGTLSPPPEKTALPPPAPESAQVAFTQAPAEGSRVKEDEVRVAWRIKNDAVVEGFLVGLNDSNPKVKVTDTSKTFALNSTGAQTITVIPLLAEGQRGETLTRKFTYQPNRAPTLTAKFAAQKIEEGDTAKLTASAKDPDGDTTAIESNINESGWTTVFNGERAIANLGKGKHKVQARAVDSDGAISDVWVGELEVGEKSVASVPQPTAPPAPQAPPAVDPALLASGLEHISQALALTKGARGDFPTDRARNLLTDAAATKDPLAQMFLARSYQRGDYGFPTDANKAKAIAADAMPGVEEKAQARDPYAAWLLASAKEEGIGTGKDPIEAMHWYNQAAKLGHPAAMNDLGWFYDNGVGVRENKGEAFDWYTRGAEAGNVNSMFNLGLCYDNGEGTRADDAQAAYWYRKAADLGHTAAMVNLAELYLAGDGMTRNENEALRWYLRAADMGDTDAMNNAANMYENGIGTAVRLDEAFDLYRSASNAGNVSAMCNLARMYDEGRGTARNARESLALYLKAAQFGNAKAMFNLGVSFDRGEGLARDPAQAAYWYTKAAEAGNPSGMFMLGWINETGTGGVKDMNRAIEWYQRAARLDHPDAQASLTRLGKTW